MKRQAHCSKKQGRKGNTNFIMLSKSQTVEPHVIKIHAAISQMTDFLKRKKKKLRERKFDSSCDSKGTSEKKYCLFKLTYISKNTVQSVVRCSNCSDCYTLTTG